MGQEVPGLTYTQLTHAQLAEWLALIEARAPALRAAGVRSLALPGGGAVTLDAGPPAAPVTEPVAYVEPELDLTNPLDDAATFGGVLPGFDLSGIERGDPE